MGVSDGLDEIEIDDELARIVEGDTDREIDGEVETIMIGTDCETVDFMDEEAVTITFRVDFVGKFRDSETILVVDGEIDDSDGERLGKALDEIVSPFAEISGDTLGDSEGDVLLCIGDDEEWVGVR